MFCLINYADFPNRNPNPNPNRNPNRAGGAADADSGEAISAPVQGQNRGGVRVGQHICVIKQGCEGGGGWGRGGARAGVSAVHGLGLGAWVRLRGTFDNDFRECLGSCGRGSCAMSGQEQV